MNVLQSGTACYLLVVGSNLHCFQFYKYYFLYGNEGIQVVKDLQAVAAFWNYDCQTIFCEI